MVITKINQRLKEKEFAEFCHLIDYKNTDGWNDKMQNRLKKFEDKMLSRNSQPEKQQQIKKKQAERREQNDTQGLRVRIKSTGKIGIGLGSPLSLTGREGHMVLLDASGEPVCDLWREDLEILCPVCDEVAKNRCSRCTNIWYCGRECQRKDWKQHKKECQ